MTTGYELGTRTRFPQLTGAILWKRGNMIEGVSAWARDERSGDYVRVYEVAATEYVQGEPQAWERGNYETVEAAKAGATRAYRWINRGR